MASQSKQFYTGLHLDLGLFVLAVKHFLKDDFKTQEISQNIGI